MMTAVNNGGKQEAALEEARQLFGVSPATVKRSIVAIQANRTLTRKRFKPKKRLYTDPVRKSVLQFLRQSNYTASVMGIVDFLKATTAKGSETGVREMLLNPDFKVRRLRFSPLLTKHHAKRRLAFSIAHRGIRVPVVHVDEKWWQGVENMLLHMPAIDKTPVKAVLSKRYILKLMVLCAFGTPTEECDGMIGAFPLVNEFVADRDSAENKKGEKAYEPLNVTRDVYIDYMVNKVIPAIREGYKCEEMVIVQQDNAPGHVARNGHDEDARAEIERKANRDGQLPRIVVMNQPPKSPDLNICDLAMFNIMNRELRRIRASAIIEEIRKSYAAFIAKIAAEGGDLSVVRSLELELDAAAEPVEAEQVDERQDAEAAESESRQRHCRPVKRQARTCITCRSPLVDQDGTNVSIACDWRGGLHCDVCAATTGVAFAGPGDTQLWVCAQCKEQTCVRKTGERKTLCLLCWTTGACSDCVEANTEDECAHFAFCSISGGKFHEKCLDAFVGVQEEQSFWCCPLCVFADKHNKLQEKFDPRNVPLGNMTTKSMMAAVDTAFQRLSREDVVKVFDVHKRVMEKIIMVGGGNHYNLHGAVEPDALEKAISEIDTVPNCTCGYCDVAMLQEETQESLA